MLSQPRSSAQVRNRLRPWAHNHFRNSIAHRLSRTGIEYRSRFYRRLHSQIGSMFRRLRSSLSRRCSIDNLRRMPSSRSRGRLQARSGCCSYILSNLFYGALQGGGITYPPSQQDPPVSQLCSPSEQHTSYAAVVQCIPSGH
jgi:hypothetical protein